MGGVLLYDQLRETILEGIEGDRYKIGDRIPSESELQELYGLSRTTVRKAIDTLVNEGRLYRVQGKGTFVTSPKFSRSLQQLSGFTESMIAAGKHPETSLKDISNVVATPRIAELLELAEMSVVQRIERVRIVDGEPLCIHIAFLPRSRGIEVTEQELLSHGGSLYATLRAKYGIIPSSVAETIEAVAADETQSKLLGVPCQSPLLYVERTMLSQFNTPIEYTLSYYRGDRYKYELRLTK
jgi:GntR family transcriptional regulator